MMHENDTTHFGYQTVPTAEKHYKVRAVFDSVADQYDVMNDLMSFGTHRLWKHFAIELTGVKSGQTVLDLASGTGDLASHLAKKVGEAGHVLMSDINAAMLQNGRDRMLNQGYVSNLNYVQINAEQLPLAAMSVDLVTIGFGLRNVTNQQAALAEMYRVLKVGGRALVLEFSKPHNKIIQKLYDAYSFNVLPKLGEWVAKDAESYQYLAESIRMHPDQATLQQMMEEAGFEHCDVHNLNGGIVAIHRGFKL